MVSDPRIGSTLAGYRIESLLGRGGMSVVYLATDPRLERKVALKVLGPELAEHPGFRERFARESRLAASLDHPNVVPVYEAGEADGVLFIAMRYVPGTDLRTVIAREGAFEPARTARIVEQVAAALDGAHRRGLVHRDVKPANVLITEAEDPDVTEHVYLSDFGVTKRRLSAGGLTATGQLVGTVDYVAPEQVRGEPVDGRADVYSLGCMTFECLTGQTPFPRDTEVAVLWAQVQTPPPAATSVRPDLPSAVDDVLARAMAKSPDERPRTAGEFARGLSSAIGIVAPAGSTGRPPVRASRPNGWTRRRMAIAMIAAASVLIAAGTTLALTRGGGTAAPSPSPGRGGGSAVAGNLRRVGVKSARAVAAIDVPASGQASSGGVPSVAAGVGFVWAMSGDGLLKVSEGNSAVGTIEVGSPPEMAFASVATGGGSVWVSVAPGRAESRIVRIDPRTNRIVTSVPIPGIGEAPIPVTPLAVGEGAVWVADHSRSRLLRIDPGSNRIVRSIKLPAAPDGLAVGEGSVWVRSNGAIASVLRIDPRTNRVAATIQLAGGADGLAVGGGSVWVTDSTNDTVVTIDPATNSIARTIPVGHDPASVVVDEQANAWVYDSGDRILVELSSIGSVTAQLAIGGASEQHGLAAAFGSIWVY